MPRRSAPSGHFSGRAVAANDPFSPPSGQGTRTIGGPGILKTELIVHLYGNPDASVASNFVSLTSLAFSSTSREQIAVAFTAAVRPGTAADTTGQRREEGTEAVGHSDSFTGIPQQSPR
jgi:hypothetical protein